MERNRNILQQALQKLPVYRPDGVTWDNIANALSEKTNADIYKKLKLLQPPEDIWNKIDRELDGKERRHRVNSVFKLVIWSLGAAAAVVIGIIIFNNNDDKANFSYSEEWLTTFADPASWTDGDSLVYRQIAQKCQVKPEVCQSDEFIRMKEELEFLDDSKKTIVSQLSKYDPDDELEIILSRIEMERSDILNQMTSFIK